MRVKIRDKIYSSSEEPILLILDPIDKLNIMAMAPSANLQCNYPNTMKKPEIDAFMDIKKEEIKKTDELKKEIKAEIKKVDELLGKS